MESRVSNLETKFDDFKTSQSSRSLLGVVDSHERAMESRVKNAETTLADLQKEIKSNNELILQMLQSLVARVGVGSSSGDNSSKGTHIDPKIREGLNPNLGPNFGRPDSCRNSHPPFIKMASHISVLKSDEIVLKLQSFHNEKIQAREKVDEFLSQYRPKYKPKSPPCLRPTLKKFKRVHDYAKYHEDGSAMFCSNSKFKKVLGFFGSDLVGKNEKVFDLLDKKVEDSVIISPVLDSDYMKSKIQACILGSAFFVSNMQKSNFIDHGYGRVGSVNKRFKSVGVHLGHNVFDELPHSTNNCVLQLGYHMPISDSGGTLITGHFTSKFQVADAYNSKFLVCNIEFLQNGTTDLRDNIELVASNFGDKESEESKIMVVGLVDLYQFMKAQPTTLENECQKEWVGRYGHHVVVGMQQMADISSLKLGFHELIHDKGGGLATDKIWKDHSRISRKFSEEINLLIVPADQTRIALQVFDERSHCDFQLGYHMPISDNGGTLCRFFTSNVQIKDAHSSKFLVCNGKFIENGTIVHLKLGFHELIRDKGGTISQRLFNSKSKNTDSALGFGCSKVVKCEVSFDYSMIIDGKYAGNLRLHHLEAPLDKNRKYDRKFTLSRFGNGCCVVCCVVLDCDYCKGIWDKGGGSKFRIANVPNAPLRPSSMTSSLSRSSSKHGDKTRSFHLAELSAATKHFSTENKIGAESFGIVYKGKLLDGREVAIKRRDTSTKARTFQGKESAFDSELALLSRFHHEHLVKPVGSCEVNNERLLVCEYMSNGSLHDHLHGENNVEVNNSIVNSWTVIIGAFDRKRVLLL